jgi:hypothetical protein
MNARRNISVRARKRHVADLDGLLAPAVSVASSGGENAPCRSRTPDRLIAICPAFGNIARARVASPRTAAGRGDLPRFVGNLVDRGSAGKPWKSPEIYEPRVFVI